MKTLTVALPGREYNIQIGWGLLTRCLLYTSDAADE